MTTTITTPLTGTTGSRTAGFDTRLWGRWVASFIGYPFAGLAARAVTGPIDSTGAAIAGGLAAGAVLGCIQSFALRRSTTRRVTWTVATAIGFGAGLAVGATVVNFGDAAGDLVLMGLLSGAAIGLLQATVLDAGVIRKTIWAIGTSALWALGWAITVRVISNADDQFANFGASGAFVATLVGGLIIAIRPVPSRSGTGRPVPTERSDRAFNGGSR